MFKIGQELVSKNNVSNKSTIQVIDEDRGIYKVIYLDNRRHNYFTENYLNRWYDIKTYNFNAMWRKINDL